MSWGRHRKSAHELRRDERGASAVEFALLAPLLLMVLLGTVTLFDLFRNAQNIEKVTYTVGDILSRETMVNTTLLSSMFTLVTHTVPAAKGGALRVTSVTKSGGKLVVSWSQTTGTLASIGATEVPMNVLPDIAEGDSVLVTESFVPYVSLVSGFGLDAITFKYRAVQRPRFVGSIVFKN